MIARPVIPKVILLLASLLLVLLVGTFATRGVDAQEPAPLPPAAAVEIPDETCLTCHRQDDLHLDFPSGTQLPVTVDEAMLAGRCTPTSPARAVTPTSPAIPTASRLPKATVTSRSTTARAAPTATPTRPSKKWTASTPACSAAGIDEAAVCADCHGSHNIQPISREKHPDVPLTASAAFCEKCHAGIHEKYRDSVHGQALTTGNPDVPTCITCHPAHTAEDPRTIDFRIKSPELCASCHADKELMAKYGISTEVFETYVADFHGKTVMLFEQTAPGQATNKAVCIDCHGVHDITTAKGENALDAGEHGASAARNAIPMRRRTSRPVGWATMRPTGDRRRW